MPDAQFHSKGPPATAQWQLFDRRQLPPRFRRAKRSRFERSPREAVAEIMIALAEAPAGNDRFEPPA